MRRRLIVAVTGASGSALARQVAGADVEVYRVVSEGAHVTIAYELGKGGLAELVAAASHVHSPRDLAAPIASSSSFPVWCATSPRWPLASATIC